MADIPGGNVCPWLQDLPESFECWPAPVACSHGDQQLTPAITPSDIDRTDDSASPKKRPRHHGEDVELTPRPPRRSVRASSSTSTSSRSPSPLKRQLMTLRLDEHGLVFRQLQIDKPPPIPAAVDLFSDLGDIGNGIEILPEDLRVSITNGLSIRGPTARAWRYSFKTDDSRNLPGRVPSTQAIILVSEWAKRCHEAEHEEAAWGEEVHHRLLEAIFRDSGTSKGDKFDFTSCQTARPHQRWLLQSGRANMIDKCIYYDTSEDIGYAQALRELARHTPTLTVNHTDFMPLQLQIIVVSIEAKKRGGRPDAKLQMGTWHAAQWAFLRWAVLAALQRSKPDEDPSLLEQQADENLSQLPFLVGIIVEGHSWAFALSTREESKTILWEDHRFGTTENHLGIYNRAV
ncbi:hypothetical protein MAC_07694 [Metarhizium acridum CQMa 102]|uniref:PD-(D/E)XK nuclease-like domain-containing protein n=1 Tax=Metarhizium acridum (strain CQMa 102) TaxID=655827 RepID=E9ECU6_METAQ|nr:uncharacterized protein MAC_07694 [Metarhizium acridum CQMa 102]EFY86240.1 hypothetical protein MAC_07694 [Metarhizium acridum CQMa 102]